MSSHGAPAPIVSAPPAVLELRAITAGYGRTTVLRGVDVSVPFGSVVALLGSNGVGKTTLLRVAAGLLAATGGTVAVDGEDVTRMRPAVRASLGLCFVPGGAGVFSSLSVRENLTLLTPPRTQDQGFDKVFELFPMLHRRLRQPAGTLSGGEQQMLALARCFLAVPKIVLIDELSTGLAPRVVDQLYTALLTLRAGGVSLLLAEQYVGRALNVADRVYVLGRDGTALSDTPRSLDQRELTRRYLGVTW